MSISLFCSPLFIEYGKLTLEAALAASTISLGVLGFIQNKKVKTLEDERDYLKKEIQKISSKVDPESDRKLLLQAEQSVCIMGINSLGPLHHCREEIIAFLNGKKGSVRVLLLDPTCDEFLRREQKEEDQSGRIRTEWHASMTILGDIAKHSLAGSLELRLRSNTPDRSLFAIEIVGGPSDRSKMLINYYPDQDGTRGYSGAQYLAEFVLERDRDTIFKNVEYFELCWAAAKPESPQSGALYALRPSYRDGA